MRLKPTALEKQRITSEPGPRFGHWQVLVIDKSGKRATCRCICGAVHAVAIAALKNGDCTSCGCKPPTSENREAVRSSRARQMLLSDFEIFDKP